MLSQGSKTVLLGINNEKTKKIDFSLKKHDAFSKILHSGVLNSGVLKAENSKLWKWLEKMLRILLFAGTKTGPISEFSLLRDGTGRTAYGENRQNPVGHGTGRNTAHL